jgi:hypothetical protein
MAGLSRKGFIIDAPRVLLKTANGNSHLATAQSGEVTFGGENIEMSGGWSFYYLSRIDTKKTLNLSLTDTQWDLDTMALVSGGTRTVAASEYYHFGVPYTVSATTHTITLPHVIVAGSLQINNFTETTGTPTATQFVTSIGATDTTVTFNTAADGVKLYPAYKVATAETTDILSTKTTDFAAAGSAIIQFPVYSDSDATDSTIEGYAQLELFKCKIMPTYSFAGQYKSGSTFKLDLEGLDPRRSDELMWRFIYNPVA